MDRARVRREVDDCRRTDVLRVYRRLRDFHSARDALPGDFREIRAVEPAAQEVSAEFTGLRAADGNATDRLTRAEVAARPWVSTTATTTS